MRVLLPAERLSCTQRRTASSPTTKPLASLLRTLDGALGLLSQRQEGGVAAGGGGVGRDGALGGEAVEVAGAAGLGAGAAETFAAERLHPDDGADHAAVD